MAEVDGFLAICGPPFFSHELDLEQLADCRLLEDLVIESNITACSEMDREFTRVIMPSMHSARDYCEQQIGQLDSAVTCIMDADSAPVPVTRGKRGLRYDVDQVADTKLRNRLLKNRESADQSRKRKLEAMKGYELLLEKQDAENKRLKDINAALVHRIAEIEEALSRHTVVRDDAQSVS
uniref:BZIP domain-containing protein n=1 Tax=Cryptomonas curvata TaxID=233186 RepID=A0A7S0QJA2_9CRYP|mmetsp:Transcript_2845/g.6146  ORF Transcript_2845/g.6146 Transcript_2845/m.6146 type:complete len:180 (+) Transcript_2845:35-574(+)